MSDECMKKSGIKSYVLDKYYISTAYREYSTYEGGSYGYETMVAEWLAAEKKLGAILY